MARQVRRRPLLSESVSVSANARSQLLDVAAVARARTMRCGGRLSLGGLCLLASAVAARPATITASPLIRRQVLPVVPPSDGSLPTATFVDGPSLASPSLVPAVSPSPSGLILGNGTSPGFMQSTIGGSGMSWGTVLGIVGGIVGLAGMSYITMKIGICAVRRFATAPD